MAKSNSAFTGLGVEALRKQVIMNLMLDQVTYISGPPGVGKTRVIEQIAHDNGFAPITFIISQMMPEDLGGMVTADTSRQVAVRLMPDVLDTINRTRESTGKRVLAFFDEINNGSSLMFGALMNLILERCAAGFCVPEDTRFICAGNPPEVSSVAQELPAPLINRMALIDFDGPTMKEFETYALQRGFHPSVVGFLTMDSNAQYLKDSADFNTGAANPTPRSWEATSKFLEVYDTLAANGQVGPRDRTEGIAARVGRHAAQMMEVALKYGDELISWDVIKADPATAPVSDQFVPAYMQTMALINVCKTGDDLTTAFTYLKRMPKEMRAVFATGLRSSPNLDAMVEVITSNAELQQVLGQSSLIQNTLRLK